MKTFVVFVYKWCFKKQFLSFNKHRKTSQYDAFNVCFPAIAFLVRISTSLAIMLKFCEAGGK